MSESSTSSTENSDEIRVHRTSPMQLNNAEASSTRRRRQQQQQQRVHGESQQSVQTSNNNNNNNSSSSSSSNDNYENDENSDIDDQQQQQLEGVRPAVPTWEFEKRMLLAETDKREEMLQKQVDELSDERKVLLKRIQMLEQQQKLNKIKLEVRGSSRSSDSADNQDELECCKQEIFVLQTDLRKMDSEMSNQQKVFVGIISGLRQDFWDAVGKYINGRNKEQTFGPTTANKLRALGERLGKIFDSAAFGQLAQLRDQLPDNYRAKDRDVSAAPVRKLSVPYIARSAMAKRDRRGSPCRPISALDLAQDNRRKNKELFDRPTDCSADDQGGIKPNKDLSPPLINASTRSVNYTKVLGLFPHITQSVVQQHWKNFTTFDENKDFCLDLQELVNASKTVFGDQYTAVQIQELLFEADRDRSNKIDFYEYLTVASMIARKEGRSQLFKTPLDADQRRSVARTCAVM